ncbi:SET domain-containing protein [Candidatus Nomurabacteria bacterium]|nr:SET domain-containing protein [Candidatus Nomurabacteria bacterium]MCB9820381.1 SET domain-containing protein [Candidatus Nomurabacteria bacterium]
MAKYSKGKKVKVGKSYAGLGLFADEDIKKGEYIIDYTGKALTEEQADKKGGKYLFEVKKNYYLDGADRKHTARYINHACNPNCEPDIYGKRVIISAIKNIKKGDELTYDYGKEYFNEFIKPHGCRCAKHKK